MKDKDIDALVVTTIDSVRYLTDINYTISSSYAYEGWVAVISRDSDPKLLGPSAEKSPMGFVAAPPPTYTQVPLVAEKWAAIIVKMLN